MEQDNMLRAERAYNYQVMPPLSADEYAELKEDIRRRGVMVPIEFDEDGNVLDGHHRLKICEELGITEYPKVIRAGLTEEQKRTHARKLNMARRHLNRDQKQELIREQLRETPEKSDRQIATELGVHHSTVGTQRETLEEIGELAKLASSIGADGKERPRQVERKPVEYIPDDNEKVIEKPEEHKPHVANNSGNNEWYTPAEYIELARAVMGGIDLDPASCEFANQTVKAQTYYSAENDGLVQEWNGRVWMNPPYSADLVGKFTRKFVDEYIDGHISEGVVLVNNATETAWFAYMADHASAVVFTRGRIRYQSPSRESLAPLQGQAFVYFGDDSEKFLNVFAGIGWGAKLYDGTRGVSESDKSEATNKIRRDEIPGEYNSDRH